MSSRFLVSMIQNIRRITQRANGYFYFYQMCSSGRLSTYSSNESDIITNEPCNPGPRDVDNIQATKYVMINSIPVCLIHLTALSQIYYLLVLEV